MKLLEQIKNISYKIKPVLEVNLRFFLICSLAGAIWGTSTPGLNMWPVAWFFLVPLLVCLKLDNSLRRGFLYSLAFGSFYHLVATSWFAALYPLNWMGLNNVSGILLATFVLIVLSVYQGVFIAIFGFVDLLYF